MDKMSLWSFLLVTIPEEALIAITTMSVAGYANLLNFKIKKNTLKLVTSILLMSITISVSRTIVPGATVNLLVITLLFPMILFLVYRHKPLVIFLGAVVSLVIMVIMESISSPLMLKLFNYTYAQGLENDTFRIIVTLPVRLFQLAAIYLILKKKKITLTVEKYPLEEWIKLALFGLMVVSSLLSIETGLKNLEKDFNTTLHLLINIIFAILFSSWMVYSILKDRKKTILNEKLRDFELQRIRKLLSEGYTDHVIDLIDSTMNERR